MKHDTVLVAIILSACSLGAGAAAAEDWPAWRGSRGDSTWNEEGIIDRFPSGGLPVRWRAPVKEGYAGPAVADGRVFIADFERNQGTQRIDGNERLMALDEATGELLWTRSWPVDYSAIMGSYAEGPRAVPTVDGDRVYLVGAAGHLIVARTTDGQELWRKHYPTDYDVGVPIFGFSSSVLIEGDTALTIVGAEPDGMVIAWNKHTGEEVWRAIETNSEPGYSQPTIVTAAGRRQLLIWHPLAITSLDPTSGEILWSFDYEARDTLSVATPMVANDRLFLTQFYGGSLMLELNDEPGVKELWQFKGHTEMPKDTLALHSLITTPIFEDVTVYGIDSYGELRALDARSGERIWEDKTMIRQGRWGSAFLVRNADRWIAFTDIGDLVLCRFTRKGYEEIDRTHLIDPTTSAGFGGRKFADADINWGHPAFANGHVIVRNDREILSASLVEN